MDNWQLEQMGQKFDLLLENMATFHGELLLSTLITQAPAELRAELSRRAVEAVVKGIESGLHPHWLNNALQQDSELIANALEGGRERIQEAIASKVCSLIGEADVGHGYGSSVGTSIARGIDAAVARETRAIIENEPTLLRKSIEQKIGAAVLEESVKRHARKLVEALKESPE